MHVAVAGRLVAASWPIERMPVTRRAHASTDVMLPAFASSTPRATPLDRPPLHLLREDGLTQHPSQRRERLGETVGTPTEPVSVSPLYVDVASTCFQTCNDEPVGVARELELASQPFFAAFPAPYVPNGLRLAGDQQVYPSASTLALMARDRTPRIVATLKLCLTADGDIASVKLVESSRYAAYDTALLAAVRTWRYAPAQANRATLPACSMVTFVYEVPKRWRTAANLGVRAAGIPGCTPPR